MTDATDSPTAAAARDAELAAARARIAELTAELDATNRGIIALTTELEQARAAEARALADHEVTVERERIATDLHQRVIQKVFGVGLALQSAAGLVRQPQAAARIRAAVAGLDEVIAELRAAVFGDSDVASRGQGLRMRLNEVVSDAHVVLGFTPGLSIAGPIDEVIGDEAEADLLAAVRIMLAEIPAGTGRADFQVEAADELVLSVDYEGPIPQDHDALATLRALAEARGGSFRVEAEGDTGTRLHWSTPPA